MKQQSAESLYMVIWLMKKRKNHPHAFACVHRQRMQNRDKKLVPGVICEEGLSGEERGKGDISLVSLLNFEPCEVLPIPKQTKTRLMMLVELLAQEWRAPPPKVVVLMMRMLVVITSYAGVWAESTVDRKVDSSQSQAPASGKRSLGVRQTWVQPCLCPWSTAWTWTSHLTLSLSCL